MTRFFFIVAASIVFPLRGFAHCPATTRIHYAADFGTIPNHCGLGFFNDSKGWRSTVNGGPPYDAKLMFWHAGFDAIKEHNPDLTVVARRLDYPAPLVWTEHVNGIRISDDPSPGGMAMMTGIDLPAAGCWEVAAHYFPAGQKDQTLSIIVLVE